MGGMRHLTDPAMLKSFHELLTAEHQGYEPWYFPLSKLDKDPMDDPSDKSGRRKIAWKKTNWHLSIDEALKYMRDGHNIGIAATSMDGLCIIDIDDIETTPDSDMKPTLSVRSRKRIGMHYFYWTTDPLCKKVIPTAHEGEMRALWSYVVAPGSFVPCSDEERDRIPGDDREQAGRYTVENARRTAEIEWKEVPPIFKKQIKEEKRLKEEQREKRKKKAATKERTQNDSALFDLTFDDIASIPDESRFPSLFHESETGKNSSIEDDMMACWRHNVTLRPLQGLAVLAGVTDCMSAGKGMPDSEVGDTTVDLSDPETLFKIWNYARDQGMIPKNDPMPIPARKWILEHPITPAPEQKCDKGELPNSEMFLGMNKAGKVAFVPILFVNWLFDQSGLIFITFKDTNEIFYYDGGIYKPHGEQEISGLLQKVMSGEHIGTYHVNEVINHIRRQSYVNREQIDDKPYLLNLKNCLYDIETGASRPHTPSHLSINQLPVAYDSAARCERFEQFVGEIMPDTDDQRTVMEMFGHTLIKDYDIQKWFMCHGDGANGKTTLLRVLTTLLGSKNVSAIKLQELEQTFSASHLYGKMANINADLSYDDVRHTGMLLQLTGGDMITAQFKNKPLFEFVNHATVIYSANILPPFHVNTHAMRRRMVYIAFNQIFTNDAIDRKLGAKLTTPESLSGILNYALKGARSLIQNKELFYKYGDDEVMRKYIQNSDSVTTFINECIEFTWDDDDIILKKELYIAYKNWWIKTKQPARMVNSNAFSRKLGDNPQMHEGRHDSRSGKTWKWIVINYDITGGMHQSFVSDGSDGSDGFFSNADSTLANAKKDKKTGEKASATIEKKPSEPSEPSVDRIVLLGYINTGIFTLGYSGQKEFTSSDLLIKYFKGHPAKIKGLTTELLTELLDANLEKLKIIKLDEKTYRRIPKQKEE